MAAQVKTCKICGTSGGRDAFYGQKAKSGKVYLVSTCKKCWNAGLRSKTVERRRAKGMHPPTSQTCLDCGVVGGVDVFSRDPQKPSGLCPYCKKCKSRRYRQRASEEKTLHATCKYCGVSGGLDVFAKTNINKTGLQTACRRCQSLITRRKKFGEAFDQFDSTEEPACEICGVQLAWHRSRGDKQTAVHVDHCHKTGQVRGLLCHDCNTGLGKFKDNPSLLWKATIYLGGMRN